MKRPERYLITAGLGGSRYADAANRLASQARATGWFDLIFTVDGQTDVLGSIALLEEIAPLAKKYPKGAGLWAWKPALVLRAMQLAPLNTHIYYIDAGCEISPLGVKRFEQLDEYLFDRSALLFHLPFLENEWTKPEMLECFPAANGTTQIQATWFGLKNDAIGRNIAEFWYEYSRVNEFQFLKDPPAEKLYPAKEHRHDQSLLSCIIKTHFKNITILPWEDVFAPWLYHRYSEILFAPVHALRNRSGISILNPIIKNSANATFVNKYERRLYLAIRIFKRILILMADEIRFFR